MRIDTLYAVPWYECNLNCGHCHVSKQKIPYEKSVFLETLRTTAASQVILFGGEPLLKINEFKDIVSYVSGNIDSVSSNLVCHSPEVFKDEICPVFKENQISLATSWNYSRFKKEQVQLWFDNIWYFLNLNIDVLVMITLTEDLIEHGIHSCMEMLWVLETMGAQKFLFEPYIGEKEVHDKADEWLCMFHDLYKGNMENLIEKKLFNWNCNCKYLYTLNPDGRLHKGCPDSLISPRYICEECLSCDLVDKCQPCMLQCNCSYPKKLYKKITNKTQ